MEKIVFGVDGSACSGAALAWATEEARLRCAHHGPRPTVIVECA